MKYLLLLLLPMLLFSESAYDKGCRDIVKGRDTEEAKATSAFIELLSINSYHGLVPKNLKHDLCKAAAKSGKDTETYILMFFRNH